jgi:signal transduction histidine kinase
MAERAAAVGGKVTAGLRPEGGFEVAARLPLAAGGDGT